MSTGTVSRAYAAGRPSGSAHLGGAVITCPKCAKENQDHYKFCLGCGAELPRDATPKKFTAGTPPHGVTAARPGATSDEPTALGTGSPGVRPASIPAVARPAGLVSPATPAAPAPVVVAPAVVAPPAPAPAAPPAVVAAPSEPPAGDAAPAGPPVICPQCEYPNPLNNKFCASCGFKLGRPAQVTAPPAVAAAPAAAMSALLTALRADGTEAGTFPLPITPLTVGRDTGSIFAGDSYLSPRHATFVPRDGKLFVRDEGSLNGVYRKLHHDDPVPLRAGNVFRIGQELLRVEALAPLPPSPDGVERLGSPAAGYVGRVALIIGRDTTGNAFPIPETGLHLGRERGDVLFPEDGYVSGLHCRITYQAGQLSLTDLGSSNGSFIRLGGETELTNGDILLMGQQLFRVTI
jgi:pSer/pThr/pTyr-binding forkhead associated (FHA) protein